MNILVIGSGGREHALVWKLKQSPHCTKLFCAPGNGGIAELAELVPIPSHDVQGLLQYAKNQSIDLTIVGPEQPLVLGIVDAFRAEGLKVFGPTKAAAQLEGSKVFAKQFMERHGIPTARFRSFTRTEKDDAIAFVKTLQPPVVVKADGLAAGKGVLVCETIADAVGAIEEIFVKDTFGKAGSALVIEEYLHGEEASVFVLTDGNQYALLSPAQDHKRILDNDLGKNTGGMGAYAPTPLVTEEVLQRVVNDIIKPTLNGMKEEGTPYTGCLYVGLMITDQGPKVLEYNCRFGDPETQVVVPLIDGDFVTICTSIAEGNFNQAQVKLHNACAVCVVMASHGYPDHYETGKKISGLTSIIAEDGVIVFHAGTRREGKDLVTAGGRVLSVTALGLHNELEQTIRRAYEAVQKISFDGAYYRSDIGKKALKYIHREA
ncbi:MAG: phosphoribosylamine--glycine ligase [Bacteroidetes bacterium]|nr:phosphoribosylamine--glycine ligase [Bacteroidota bacterium]